MMFGSILPAASRGKRIGPIALLLAFAATTAGAGESYSVAEKSITALDADMAAGRVTSEQLVRAYLGRIAVIDKAGPALHSVIALNPHALEDARRLDAERRAGHVRGALHGIPLLVKDNIETGEDMATTAGSLALKDNFAADDAPVIRRLKAAGAVVLGKTNLSEWANIRSNHSISGWSAIGGLVKNPYVLDRSACGSSSGTGAAIAASLAAAGVGTETDGSVTCPSALAALVGLKPTVGLVSRARVVPISHSQDTPGPMARNVEDAAILLTAMAGTDAKDPATADADRHVRDYAVALKSATLRGKRLGILFYATGLSPSDDAVFAQAIEMLKAKGAVIVGLTAYKPPAALGDEELAVLMSELKADLNAYLASTPAAVKTRTLADLIAFDRAHPRELALFGQELFEKAQTTKGLNDPAYRKTRATSLRQTGAEIDKLIADNKLDALIAPSYTPAPRIDVVTGDAIAGSSSSLPAIAGYPHLTVPMGQVAGLPVGLSFIGPAWTEDRLLALGYAFEQATHARKPPHFQPSLETTAPFAEASRPMR